jgi:hypothetical protein
LDRIIPADFQGTVHCDGYAAYPSFANRSEGRITLAACWAHARRKFVEAAESAPQRKLTLYPRSRGRATHCHRVHDHRSLPKPQHCPTPTYLREVLTRLPSMINRQIIDVRPEAWGKTQQTNHQRKAA